MSYTSESQFRAGTTLTQIRDVVQLMGYKKARDDLRVPDRVGEYFWFETRDYRSWTGVELNIYRTPAGRVSVTTRSRSSRSYWDLDHQNRTLKILRDFGGGCFTTDAGRNRYWRPDEPPPRPAQSGCYLAKWRFHNALIKARLYLANRKFEGPIARAESTGLPYMDEMNPRLLSNNMLLPYLVAIWEDFHKSCFSVLLRYSARRAAVLRAARLQQDRLEAVAAGIDSVEDAVTETFSFQRPSTIAVAFRLLDPNLDYTAALKQQYRRRRVTLFDRIEGLVEQRHLFVHRGDMDTSLFDRQLTVALADIEVAADRVYVKIAKHNSWKPLEVY